ncbi:pyridoxamine 5'-phosphate oxidase family protein [Methylobacterium sp. J-068]|uniref:pyridoxamine 5'-phosphate oxidase family protein n=1 Tax=Methylobacterium sp. J-068 TaxID=2836649 RepID=UPI001FBB7716|nr:pyridoxamine 5'-phosphate oxidase family protein [Methylobacterium sp. J-068]MCJ2033281.1 pyridoxamine 5'-phosphate oxidase family protein [Methylobacterium sp. J-068]
MSRSEPVSTAPWHAGEIAMQARIGVAGRMAELGPRVIRDHLTEQHRAFYGLLPFVVLGAVDPAGDVWATLRTGAPGFLEASDPTHLRVRAPPEPGDPAEAGFTDGAAIGLLGIDLATRRRNRLNGILRRADGDGFTVRVQQGFGNCPQYIHVRPAPHRVPAGGTAPEIADRLDPRARALVAGADTFFVATYAAGGDGGRQVDVSHRGGPAGFVRVEADGTLTVPDYSGNRFFNTLGNMLANPRAGLVFVDFAGGDLLQMTGRAEVLPDASGVTDFPGAERLWRFSPRTIVRRPGAWPLRFDAAPATARSR